MQQLTPPSVMENQNDNSNVIDLQEILSNSLGLPYEIVREAAPLVFEIGLRLHEVLSDVTNENYPTNEAIALAQAASAAMVLGGTAEALGLDPDDLLCRLLEAGQRGLFDITTAEAPDHLTELFNRFNRTEETE